MTSADEASIRGVDDPGTDIDRDGERILSVEGIGERFSGLQALGDVDITANCGEIIGPIGPNGVGKTTLFSCISGAFPPTNGTVRLDGEVVSGLPACKIAQAGLAWTFQITRPLEELAVVEDMMVGTHTHTHCRSEAREIITGNLEFVRLADKTEEETGELTMDVRKRLELARAVSTRSEILPLNEIMAGPTPSESNQMLDLFRQLRGRGTSLLIIEHDMKAITNISDCVRVPDQGEGITFDAPGAVVEDDHVVGAYIEGFDVGA